MRFKSTLQNTTPKLFGRSDDRSHRYIVEYSADKKNWNKLVDQSQSTTDNSHQYLPLDEPTEGRYVKITNIEVPDGYFAISGLRVFGKGNGEKPEKVTGLKVQRDSADSRIVKLSWSKALDAIGYNIRYGITPDKLYQTYQVYGDTTVIIRSLSKNQKYFYAIEAFNENGVGEKSVVVDDQ